MWRGVDRFADGLTLTIQTLQLGAEQFAGLGVNVFDFQPVGASCGFVVVVVVVGLVEGEPAEQQVGE